jgi:hypothetical protein
MRQLFSGDLIKKHQVRSLADLVKDHRVNQTFFE